jgi:hypothetical protein
MAYALGTKEKPTKLKTPPGTSDFEIYRDEKDGKEILVCVVGKTVLHYDARCIPDLHAFLKKHGDWMNWAAPMKTNPPRKVRSRPGDARRKIPSAAGMD